MKKLAKASQQVKDMKDDYKILKVQHQPNTVTQETTKTGNKDPQVYPAGNHHASVRYQDKREKRKPKKSYIKGLVKTYRVGWAGTFRNVADKKHIAHPLLLAQN